MAEHVVDANLGDGGGAHLAEVRGHSLPQAAHDVVLLHGDNAARLLGCLAHQLRIQGLDGVHIDEAGVDAGGLQGLHGLDSLAHHQAGGDDGDVLAVPQGDALANLKLVVLVVVEALHSQAAQTDVHRAHMLGGGLHGGQHFVVVGGVQNHHAGDGAHQGDVLAALVGGAVLAHGDARVGAHNLHVEVGVAHGVAHLLKGAARGEHGEGRREGHLPAGGQAGGNANHVALGDAAVDKALRVFFLEDAGLGGLCQIRVQHNDVGVRFGQCGDCFAKALTGGLFHHFSHSAAPPDSR